jgi:hypothetical protein
MPMQKRRKFYRRIFLNTLEALLSLIALLAFFAAMLSVLSAQEENISLAQGSMESKGESFLCAEIIDSIYSNGIDSYAGEMNCTLEGKEATASRAGGKKETETLAEIENGLGAEVKTFGHYLK